MSRGGVRIFGNYRDCGWIQRKGGVWKKEFVLDDIHSKITGMTYEVLAVTVLGHSGLSFFSCQLESWFDKYQIAGADSIELGENLLFSASVGFNSVGCIDDIKRVLQIRSVKNASDREPSLSGSVF